MMTSPFELAPELYQYTTTPEIELWRSVIWKLLRDLQPLTALEPRPPGKKNWERASSMKWRHDAIQVLQSDRFDELCELAELDPAGTRRVAHRVYSGEIKLGLGRI